MVYRIIIKSQTCDGIENNYIVQSLDLEYPWWFMPTQRWFIQSFVNTSPGMVFTKLITIIYRVGISIVGYTNTEINK